MTWIKICGTTNLEDALMSVEAGADALGFVFWEKSPRNVDPSVVRRIVSALPTKVEKVGVFVGEPFERVQRIVEEAELTAAQLHFRNPAMGDWEDANFRKYVVVQASEIGSNGIPSRWADAIFLDSGNSQKPGGTGKTFDWQENAPMAETFCSNGHKIVVAGGLTPENVGEAIRILEPWGVDVVSGVEASPGKKDPAKVKAFVRAVREASK
jgi:phosphoribosylanthranilate isomerase